MEIENKTYQIMPSRLEGKVTLSGAKNSALRLLAATLLTGETIELDNYPDALLDCRIHVEMLKQLGKTCSVSENRIVVSQKKGLETRLDWHGPSIRNTLLILGALVARNGQGAVPLPGGCQIGERKYDLHEMLLKKLGAEVWVEGDFLCAEVNGRLKGADIVLPIRSTGATENAIICGSLAEGTTKVWNPHIRPEILDLISLLREMGATIHVYGQEHIEIHGTEYLCGTRHRTIPDNMEAITWLIGSVITDGDVEIIDFPFEHLEVPLIHLRESGAKFYKGYDRLIVRGGRCYPVEISTGPYPGINSDMQPLFAVFGICANGESRIIDLRFPGRYKYAKEMEKMGAEFLIIDNLLSITGNRTLRGGKVKAIDLRAGAALALLAQVADGETIIEDAWQIDRGYNRFFDKMMSLNAQIGMED